MVELIVQDYQKWQTSTGEIKEYEAGEHDVPASQAKEMVKSGIASYKFVPTNKLEAEAGEGSAFSPRDMTKPLTTAEVAAGTPADQRLPGDTAEQSGNAPPAGLLNAEVANEALSEVADEDKTPAATDENPDHSPSANQLDENGELKVQEGPADENAEETEEGEEPDFDSMNKAELFEYSKTELEVEQDASLNKADLLAAVKKAYKKAQKASA